jgi:hypothetical protein
MTHRQRAQLRIQHRHVAGADGDVERREVECAVRRIERDDVYEM